ncbi:MAG TPA: hypothetical protein HPP91_12195 [Gammaproteobacteria bacterium]|nr:hypothetical protein [Gammaproteobacteria bacterium]
MSVIKDKIVAMRKKDRTPIGKTSRRIAKEDLKSIRRASRDAQVNALREGRKCRAATFVDRKKEGNRTICRDKIRYWTG